MLFALTRSNLPRQLPGGNAITLRLSEIVTAMNSIGTYSWNCDRKHLWKFFRSC